MIIEKLSVTATNLNLGTDQILPVKSVSFDADESGYGKVHYRPTEIRINNNTGANISILLLNDIEKREYDDSNTDVTGTKHTIANGVSEVFNMTKAKITNVIVQGAGSGHTSTLDIFVIKE